MQPISADVPPGTNSGRVADNVEQLKNLFPQAVRDGRVDFEVLKQLLGGAVLEQEPFGLQWQGKRRACQLALAPTTSTLLPCPDDSVEWDATRNLMIEGDNLEVLKLLRPDYAGKIKFIYIDPPYNTGNDFVYQDDFRTRIRDYRALNEQGDRTACPLSIDGEAYGLLHTAWLNMMYPRLLLARELLTADGVMFVSIDENEVHHLRAMMDQIFGEENFINSITVKTKESSGASGGGEDKKLKKNVESLLFYCRDLPSFSRTDVFRREFLADVIAAKVAQGKSYEYRQVLTNPGRPELITTIQDGAGGAIEVFQRIGYQMMPIEKLATAENLTLEEAYSRWHRQIFRTTNAQTSIRTRVHRVLGDHDGLYSIDYVPRSGKNRGKRVTKFFLGPSTDLLVWLADTSLVEEGRVVKLHKAGTLWDDLKWTGIAKEGGVEFNKGKKPVAFIQRMLEMTLASDPDAIVLDFFAGSGTTGHAVWKLNMQENARRRFILVQLLEALDPSVHEQRAAVAFCEELGKPNRLSELTKERLRRSAARIKAECPHFQGDLGFRVYRLAPQQDHLDAVEG